MLLTALLLIVGFAVLIKGADLLVDGSSSIARRLGVSDIVIGLTIVAFGTSAPELVVSVVSAINGTTDIAIGNILGSNTANILLILGVSALIYPLTVRRNTIWKEVPLSLLAALVVGILANDRILDGAVESGLTRSDGLILLSFFVIFLYYMFSIAKSGDYDGSEAVEHAEAHKLPAASALVAAGLAALILGGIWVVESATELARLIGWSESLIGLTVVAVGTSLPELATSAVAAYRRKADIAIGNVVGSNIFNIFWILGVSAFIAPLPFTPLSNFDIAAVIASSLLLFAAMFVGSSQRLDRWQGAAFVAIYAGYIAHLILRG